MISKDKAVEAFPVKLGIQPRCCQPVLNAARMEAMAGAVQGKSTKDVQNFFFI